MPLEITNSLTRKKELFVPLESGKVSMYVCGPTVYNFIHVGNARPYVFFDVVRRYLEYLGYAVTHVMNFTDVDDKIINRANQEKTDAQTIANKFVGEFWQDARELKLLPPHVSPRVTEHIPQIIKVIDGLILNAAAYAVEGEVFFSVRDFEGYGKLSGKRLDEILIGARVDPNEKKSDPLDFSLWKPQKSPQEPAWESPWGKGRPGWHIECSAKAMEYLGESFDIHGGGIDLIHPHHENEIAQSEAYTQKPFVKYWMHNNMLHMDAVKMSKSLGNIVLARDFIQRYSGETLKFLLLSGHYRSTIDFSEKHIKECQVALHRIYSTIKKCQGLESDERPVFATEEEKKANQFSDYFENRWREALDDDFNTPKVFGLIFEYVRAVNACLDKKPHGAIAATFLTQLERVSGILNLFQENPEHFLGVLRNLVLKDRGLEKEKIEEKIKERSEARKKKDFKTSDAIRAELLKLGVEIRDTPKGVEWDIF